MLNLIGFLLPPLIDLLNKKVDSKDARFWTSVFVCIAFGLVVNFIESNGFSNFNEISLVEFVEGLSLSAMAMFGIAQITYRGIGYKDSNLQNTIRGI